MFFGTDDLSINAPKQGYREKLEASCILRWCIGPNDIDEKSKARVTKKGKNKILSCVCVYWTQRRMINKATRE